MLASPAGSEALARARALKRPRSLQADVSVLYMYLLNRRPCFVFWACSVLKDSASQLKLA